MLLICISLVTNAFEQLGLCLRATCGILGQVWAGVANLWGCAVASRAGGPGAPVAHLV